MHGETGSGVQAEELLRQMERFEWIAEEVRDAVACCDVEAAGRLLVDEEARLGERERAAVMLALHGSPQAGEWLHRWEPAGGPARLQLLCRIARREWRRRCGERRNGEARAAA